MQIIQKSKGNSQPMAAQESASSSHNPLSSTIKNSRENWHPMAARQNDCTARGE